ncbi:MAG: flagellar hook-basal body complex protein FliE [bacterium]|nr:flagellar hook-basal body complex protein FliE [bacterium]
MSMEFSTTINSFNPEYNLNSIEEYNKFLRGNASFDIETETTEFGKALEKATKTAPLRGKNDPTGVGNFMSQIGSSISSGLDTVNAMKIEANRMQEDLAMGGPTSIHDAMIAAEKADLSLRMAMQIRNRIVNAYSEITQMAL